MPISSDIEDNGVEEEEGLGEEEEEEGIGVGGGRTIISSSLSWEEGSADWKSGMERDGRTERGSGLEEGVKRLEMLLWTRQNEKTRPRVRRVDLRLERKKGSSWAARQGKTHFNPIKTFIPLLSNSQISKLPLPLSLQFGASLPIMYKSLAGRAMKVTSRPKVLVWRRES